MTSRDDSDTVGTQIGVRSVSATVRTDDVPWTGSDRRKRLPPGWSSTIQPRILARDGHRCYVCGGHGADAVDHRIPGDDHNDANLGAIHQDVPPYCHRKKTAAEANSVRWSRGRMNRAPERHPGLR